MTEDFFIETEVENTRLEKGADHQDTQDPSETGPTNLLEHLELFLKKEGLNVARHSATFSLTIFSMLILGAICWLAGRWTARFLFFVVPPLRFSMGGVLPPALSLVLALVLLKKFPRWLKNLLEKLNLPPVHTAIQWRQQENYITMPLAIAASVVFISVGVRVMMAFAQQAMGQ